MIVCGIIFLAQKTFGISGMSFINDYLALHSFHSDLFRPHQIITHIFLHANLSHLLLNLLGLWVFGARLEYFMGPKRLLNFLLICAMGAAFAHLIYLYFQQEEITTLLNRPQTQPFIASNLIRMLNTPTMGISGVVFGCMAAFALLFPNLHLYLYFLIPIQAKWIVLLLFLFEIGSVVQSYIYGTDDGVARIAHIGGGITGAIFTLNAYKKRPPDEY